MKASKKQAPAKREWDVNATVIGGRHIGRFTAETGLAAVKKAERAATYNAKLCPKCESKAEDLRVDRYKIVATEVGGASEVYRTGEPDNRSPAYQLVDHVWKHKLGATGHSWQRINAAMHQALSLAISAGLVFHENDVIDIYANMRGTYWFNAGGAENFYPLAVNSQNYSACKAIEKAVGRPAFVYEGARLHVGSNIAWEGRCATVTSFASDGLSLIACTYAEPTKEHPYRSKVERRLTITLDEIKAAEKSRKATIKENTEVEKVRAELLDRGHAVPTKAIRAWNKKQRAEALAWASVFGNIVPLPTFIREAIDAVLGGEAA